LCVSADKPVFADVGSTDRITTGTSCIIPEFGTTSGFYCLHVYLFRDNGNCGMICRKFGQEPEEKELSRAHITTVN